MTLDDLYRLMKTGHEQAQGVVDTIQVPLLVLDQSLCVLQVNPAFLDAFSTTRDDVIGNFFLDLGDGEWRNPELERLLRNVIPKTAAILEFEFEHDFQKIGRRLILISAWRLRHPGNNSTSMLVIFNDVTSARDKTAREDIILAEIRHRFKNFLGLVAALARQSSTSGQTVEQYRESLLGRINALATAELAALEAKDCEIDMLLKQLMDPYGDRVEIVVHSPVHLKAEEAASLSLMLHELATNAVKYGALSTEAGRVRLQVSTTHDEPKKLQFMWREEGGPAPAAADNKGFGTRLIRLIAAQQLGGSVDMEMKEQGLEAKVSFTLK